MADIHPRKCIFEYGNPSAHSLVVIVQFWTFIDLCLHRFKLQKLRPLALVLKATITLAMGFCRVYLGLHTYN